MLYVDYYYIDIGILGKMGQLKELQPLTSLMGKGCNLSETEPFSFLPPELCLFRGTEDALVFYRKMTGML